MQYEDIINVFNTITELAGKDDQKAVGLHVADLGAKVIATHFERQRIIIEQNRQIIEKLDAIGQSVSLSAGAVSVDPYGVSSLRTHPSV